MTSERLGLLVGAAAFCLIAILNSGGYRYGIGDQAFYIPAVIQHFDAGLFPRDRLLLHAQDRLMVFDDLAAALAHGAGVSVPVIFFAAYLLAMVLLFGGLVSMGRTMYRSWWTVALLTALLTLRHRITQTGANTLESYFHPRLLAFAIGVWALAAFMRARTAAALLLVVLACIMHPTTGIWFGMWVIVALAVSEPAWRPPLAAFCGVAGAAAVWAVSFGPLQGHLGRMDPVWASVLAGKDYVFPSDWGPAFWLVNFGYLAIAGATFQMRRRRGIALPREFGLVIGAASLAALFLASWPLMSAGVALALQLQTSRIFWLLDLLAGIYLAWLFAEASPVSARKAIVGFFVASAVARGVYVMGAEHAGDPIVRLGLPRDNWGDAMAWISGTPTGTHVLADPGHAWKYGSSVRVSGERDVLIEEVKDTAVALYSRDVAMWVLGRIQDTQHFDALTAEQFRGLGARYDLDYLVIDRDVALPLAYRNAQFRIYQLGLPPTP
ncbi:MAG: hypothetical protein ND807_00520 [Vicinamibacterales bacterium]|nr:hypothetical protein [Vicinamibacterales bacterium]